MSVPIDPRIERFSLSPRPSAAATEVLVGRRLLERLPQLILEHAPAPVYVVVSDATVGELYGAGVRDGLRAAGSEVELVTFPPGERSKSPERWAEVLESFGAMGLGRDGCVVSVGGGVTGDLAGFAAAAYARGVALVQVPTSLLAMIDASIGGKAGLDLRAGKNLAGAFYDPALVVADPAVLRTLPAEELRNGLAEAVKHGAIADAAYFDFLSGEGRAVLALEEASVDRVVVDSVRVKVGVVERDAREVGERAVLNFGHTIGHAIERITEYGVSHGHAVSIGMVAEAMIGEEAGVTEAGVSENLAVVLASLGLPIRLPAGVDPGEVVAGAASDKKARAGRVRYALLASIGDPARGPDGGWTHVVPEDVVRRVLGRLAGSSAREGEV